MYPYPWSTRWTALCRWLALLLGLAIPVSTAGTNIVFALFVLAWLCSGHYAEKWAAIRRHRAASSTLVLLGLMALGILYSTATAGEAVRAWLSYKKWLLLPMLVAVLDDAKWQRRMLFAVLGAMVATAMLSCLSLVVELPAPRSGHYQDIHGVLFTGPTTQSLFFGLACFGCLHQALSLWRKRAPAWRPVALLAAALALAGNIFYVCGGRTTFIVFSVLVPVVGWQRWRWRGLVVAVLAWAAVTPIVWSTASHLRTRSLHIAEEVRDYESRNLPTSTGLRLAYYRNGWELFRQRVLLGSGVGSIRQSYRSIVEGKAGAQAELTNNLHNEYLNMAVQFGLVGVVAFLWWLFTHWQAAQHQPAFARHMAQLVVLAYAIGALGNSVYTTFAEGFMYAYLLGLLLASHRTEKQAVPVRSGDTSMRPRDRQALPAAVGSSTPRAARAQSS